MRRNQIIREALVQRVLAQQPSSLSLEEAVNGKAQKELEKVFYAELSDFTQLRQAASTELHEQWQIMIPKTEKNAAKGSIRVRKTIKDSTEPEYSVEIKKSNDDPADRDTVPQKCTEDFFQLFKYLAEKGMIKKRFVFPVDGINFEIDCFLKPKQNDAQPDEFHPWVKIDIELKDLQTPIPELPIKVERLIKRQYPDRTPDEEAIVVGLYETVFTTKNVHLLTE